MSRYARIQDGVVAEIIVLAVEPAEAFTAEIAATLIACPDNIVVGQAYSAGTFSPIPAAPPPTQAELEAYANGKQWALATGGFTATIEGASVTFATDAESQALMTGKAVRLGQAGAPTTIDWQFAKGFATISSADFLAAAVKIADFVQATFDALKVVLSDIAGGSITTVAAIDAYAWPAASAE